MLFLHVNNIKKIAARKQTQTDVKEICVYMAGYEFYDSEICCVMVKGEVRGHIALTVY